jgi:hypothetical protein
MLTPLLLVLVLQISADGLREGERFTTLAPALRPTNARAPEHESRYGLVLDAQTGKPVPGARVETWTSAINAPFGGFHRIGMTTTGADGRYLVRIQSGQVKAEKLRISASGYLTLSATAGDIFDTLDLFPAEAQPPRIRVVDLEGRPIAGAHITSTYSSNYDASALDVRTGADGTAVLHGYGLQKDIPDLRIRAEGFAPIKYVDGEACFDRREQDALYTVRMRRSTPYAVALLNRAGQPLVHAPAFLREGDFFHVQRTDEQGLVRVGWRHGWRDINVHTLSADEPQWFGMIVPVPRRIPKLRPHAEEWPKTTPVGRLILELEGNSPPDELDVYAHSETGWMRDYDEWSDPIVFPAGKGYLCIGAPFSGVKQQVLDFDLKATQDLTLRPRFVPEPNVTFLLEKPKGYSLTVQVGQHSREEVEFNIPVAIPGSRPVQVLLGGKQGVIYWRFQPAGEGMTYDLNRLLREQTPAAARPRKVLQQKLQLIDAASGKPIEGKVRLHHSEPMRLESKGKGSFVLEGGEGRSWLVEFESKGGPKVFARGRIDGSQRTRVVARPAWASVELTADFKFRLEGGEQLDLEQLPAGPLDLILRTRAGQRFGLSLRLEPGERRRLHVRR